MKSLQILCGALLLIFGVLIGYAAIFAELAIFVRIVVAIIAALLFGNGLLLLIKPRWYKRLVLYIVEYPLD